VKKKIIDLKMSGGGGDVANVNLQKIGEVLREEEIKASAGGYEGMQASHDLSKDTDIKRGGGGVETRVAHKGDETTESVREQLPLSDEAGHAEEEVSAAETVVSAPQAAGPDMSQAVGNAIFYSNSDREQAGRNAKEFLGAVQRVKQHVHQNARLRDVVATKVGTDVEWFHSHLDNDIVPRPPSDPAPPHARKISRHAISQGLADAIGVSEFPSGRVSSARSNAELISLHAEENTLHQSTTAGSMPGVPIDLDTIESGLGMDRGQILPLSENHIQGQIDEWRQINLDAEVHAMQTKMAMLSRFSANSLSRSVGVRAQSAPTPGMHSASNAVALQELAKGV